LGPRTIKLLGPSKRENGKARKLLTKEGWWVKRKGGVPRSRAGRKEVWGDLSNLSQFKEPGKQPGGDIKKKGG